MLLSIIVPVYNCNEVLKCCVESLFAQRRKDFEVIFIDDGSTDNSLSLLKELTKGKENVQVLSQNNQGVSATRNRGINCAHGDYISFVDADDYLDCDFCEHLMAIAETGNADLIMSGAKFCNNGVYTNTIAMKDASWRSDDLKGRSFLWLDNTTSIHGKLYRRSVILQNHIEFDTSMSYAEDRDFNIVFLSCAKGVSTSSYIGYNYVEDTEGSLSKQRYQYKMKNDFIYWNKIYNYLKESEIFNDTRVYLVNRLFNFLVDNCVEVARSFSIKEIILIYKEARPFFNKSFLTNNIESIYAPFWQKKLLYVSISFFVIVEVLLARL